jgi:DNA primase
MRGYALPLIIKAGLAKGSEKSAEPYDVFRDRIMFPIADASGRVVGFSGRDQSGDSAAPKYVNSPETPLYEKSRILFGYDKAKTGIRALDFTLIVEGQFDLVLAHQAGYTNTVAISGTAMTDAHAEQINRLSKKAVLALDADKAGIASAKRSAALMLLRDMDVKVARIEGGKDPADLVKDDPKLLKHTIGSALHVIPFLIEVIRKETNDERVLKLRVREEVVPFVTYLPNRIDGEHFEGLIAEAIGTTKDAIHFEVERVREEVKKDAAREAKAAQHQDEKSENKVPEAPKKLPALARTEDIVFHLYGVLLWQQSIEAPLVSSEKLRTYLGDILSQERLVTLEDWPPDMKNKAAFLAEAAYEHAEEKTFPETLSALLRELDLRVGKESLVDIRSKLREAERIGDREQTQTLLTLASTHQKRITNTESADRTFILR